LVNVGAGIGIELRDANMVLNAKNNRVLKNGMTLSIFGENMRPTFSDTNCIGDDHRIGTILAILRVWIRRMARMVPILWSSPIQFVSEKVGLIFSPKTPVLISQADRDR
jgi:hypothetical protein